MRKTSRYLLTSTSPATATTAVGDTVLGLDQWDAIGIVYTVQGASGGTLDICLQTSYDGGTTWWDYVRFAQITAGAAAVSGRIYPFAFEADFVTVGKGSSPAMTKGTCAGGFWGDQMRVLYTSGAGTVAGASQTIEVIGTGLKYA